MNNNSQTERLDKPPLLLLPRCVRKGYSLDVIVSLHVCHFAPWSRKIFEPGHAIESSSFLGKFISFSLQTSTLPIIFKVCLDSNIVQLQDIGYGFFFGGGGGVGSGSQSAA